MSGSEPKTSVSAERPHVHQNLVLIDSRVLGYESLIASLGRDTEWFLLDAEQDGVTQMQQILAGVALQNTVDILEISADTTAPTLRKLCISNRHAA